MKHTGTLVSHKKEVIMAAVADMRKTMSLAEIEALVGLSAPTICNIANGSVSERTALKIIAAAKPKQEKKVVALKMPELNNDLSDIAIAHKYCQKADNASAAGHSFKLSFDEYKNLILQKFCAYTDIKMTRSGKGAQAQTDITIDRVDNSKGYVDGNVVACCFAANQLKGHTESPANALNINGALMVLNRAKALLEKQK